MVPTPRCADRQEHHGVQTRRIAQTSQHLALTLTMAGDEDHALLFPISLCLNTNTNTITRSRYGGNSTHMPTDFVEPDDNRHEGWCSGDWTLGMISDKVDHDSGDG